MKSLIYRLAAKLRTSENSKARKDFASQFFNKNKEVKVKSGPFKGLIYPFRYSLGSAFFPKIIGSYECELWPLISRMKKRNYDQIFDVGCAEGFYAVGLATVLGPDRVWAYDLDRKSEQSILELSKANGLENVVQFKNEEFTLNPHLEKGKRTLVFMDIEGAENDVFRDVEFSEWKNTDFLVECHVWANPSFVDEVIGKATSTHNPIQISSWDKERKKFLFRKELSGFTTVIQDLWVEEGRRMTTEWLYLEAKYGSFE